MNELLRQLLVVREQLNSVVTSADELQVLDQLPELSRMQKLERLAFKKINKWSE